MDLDPICTKRIYRSIIEQFVELIRIGELKPGEKLPPERVLAEQMQVSISCIREAFSVMEVIGLVEIRIGDGTSISDLNIAPFFNTIAPLLLKNDDREVELLEFRELLETEAVELAALKGKAEQIKLLEQILKDMKKAADEGNRQLEVIADTKFHSTLFLLTGNYILMKASECVVSLLECSVRFSRGTIMENTEDSVKLYNQHVAIFEAIEKRDPELAKQAMNDHMSFIKQKMNER